MNAGEDKLAVERLYREYKPLLTSIAYRMLGSMSEAEDAVQDVFVSFSRRRGAEIGHPKAYLVKMVANRALNMMKAAPRRRESYPGPWLPEPIIEADDPDAPLGQLMRRERLGYALLVLLQNCTPPERAVFVLHESFGYDYADIAAMLDKSAAACRKLFSRASAKIGRPQREATEDDASDPAMDRFVRSFADALESGRAEAFVHLLADDAVLLSDGGGIVRAALNPIEGPARIAAFFVGIAGKGALAGRWHRVRISGQRGLLLERDGLPPIAFALAPDDRLDMVREIYLVSNPHKLTRISR